MYWCLYGGNAFGCDVLMMSWYCLHTCVWCVDDVIMVLTHLCVMCWWCHHGVNTPACDVLTMSLWC